MGGGFRLMIVEVLLHVSIKYDHLRKYNQRCIQEEKRLRCIEVSHEAHRPGQKTAPSEALDRG